MATSRRDDVLQALIEAGAEGVSGERLARSLGISRAAVAKHVAALQASGYVVEARPGRGYRLVDDSDVLLPAEVAPLLTTSFWKRLEGGDETSSTNDDAKRLAAAGAPEGTVVLARRQTAGRGRLGRTWESPAGGVYVSVILKPDIPLAGLVPLPLVLSVGVALGLERIGITDVGLKWPNDIWLDEGKLAGVLLESSAEADRAEWVVAGIGLNVRPPAQPAAGAAYVSHRVPSVRLANVAASVLDGVATAYQGFTEGGFSLLREEYERRSVLDGASVAVRRSDGGLIASGAVVGVDDLGRLLLDEAGTVVAVASGDVTLRTT